MKVQIIDKNGVHEFDEPRLVLVTKNDGTPLAVASETGVPDTAVVASIDTPDFNEVLHSLGINKTVFIQRQRIALP